MKQYRVVVEDGLRHTGPVEDPDITFDQVRVLSWLRLINWGAPALSVEIDVSDCTGPNRQGPWKLLRRVYGVPAEQLPASSVNTFIPDWEVSRAPKPTIVHGTVTNVHNVWDNAQPAPGAEDARVRVVIDEGKGPGCNRYCFTQFSADVTLATLEIELYKMFGSFDKIKLNAPETFVEVDVREAPDEIWRLHRTLKPQAWAATDFGTVIGDRKYQYGVDVATVSVVNPEPMRRDPVIAETLNLCPCVSVALRQTAQRKRREADELDALARVADSITPNSPEEHALWDLINKRS